MNKKNTLIVIGAAVIVTSLVCMVIFFTVNTKKTMLNNAKEIGLTCQAKYPHSTDDFKNCYYSENQKSYNQTRQKQTLISFLAFGLPIIFFGGVLIYTLMVQRKKQQ